MWDKVKRDFAELVAKEDWTRAEALLRRVVGRKGVPGAMFYNLGKVLLKRGKPEQSGEWFRRAVAADPHYPPSWIELGVWHMARREYAKAHEAFVRAGKLMPQDPDCQRMAGRAALALGDWKGAATAYGELRRLAPDDAEALIKAYTAASELRAPEAEMFREELMRRPDLRGAFLNTTVRLSSGRLPIQPNLR